MSDIKAGDLIKKPYPFKHYCHDYKDWQGDVQQDEGWAGGCHIRTEDDGSDGMGNTYHDADGEGFIEYEVLAVAEMPRKYQSRILYRVTMIDPEGCEHKKNKCHTVTESKFRSWIESNGSSYQHEYEVS